MTVTIDGPAGSGKSTVARLVADKIGFSYLNSGRLYRAAAWVALRQGPETVVEDLLPVLGTLNLRFGPDGATIIVENEHLNRELQLPEIDAAAARISKDPRIRTWVNSILKAESRTRNIIVEGRDMGTEVFPDAEVKFFFDASLEARAKRRWQEGLSESSLEEVTNKIQQRDEIDTSKAHGALRPAADARVVDTSGLTIKDVCDIVIQSIQGHKSPQEYIPNMAEKENQVSSGAIPSKQEMLQEEYLKSLDELEDGQVIEGVVAAVTDEQVFVDVGYKSEGKININEFDAIPSVGDTVQVVLITKEGRHGEIIVSKRKADERVVWKEIKEAFAEHKPVSGKVLRTVKGGFEIGLGGGTKGFNPISKMDLFRIEDAERYVGLESSFYIERLYSEKRVNIILSRRTWLEEQVASKRAEFFASVQEGDIVKGIVKTFTSFGAFVDLGGFDGLLHVNDMSWGHVARPKDYVKKGEELELKVVKLDVENQKINLSLKEMTSNPWDTFHERFELDQTVEGTVTKLTDFGAFIEIEPGIEGLAHISELSWTRRIKHPRELFAIGDKVQAKILGFDLDARKVSLGVKQAQDNPWEGIAAKYTEGMRLTRPVKKITASGAFIELEEGIDGFLHVDDLSWTKKYKNPGAVLKEGEEVEVMVLQANPEHRDVRLGIKQLSEDPWASLKKAYPEGSIIEGEITNITDFGLFVRVQGGIEGLVPKSHIVDSREENVDEAIAKFKVGDQVKVAIMEIAASRQKLSLSFREIERQVQRKDMAKYIHDEGDSSESHSITFGDFLKKGDE